VLTWIIPSWIAGAPARQLNHLRGDSANGSSASAAMAARA
jgi:hypothetical protein